MRSLPVCTLAFVTLALALVGCSSAPQSDPAVANYLKTTWGIELSGYSQHSNTADDGTQTYSFTGKITVDGLGSNDFQSQTIIPPMSQGSDTTLTVANSDGSDERYFLYDQVQNYITIGDYTKGVAVSKNPDNSYEVWAFNGTTKDQFLTVPNGLEALKQVELYNGFKTISPYILLTAFASAHNAAPAARMTYSWRLSNAAAPPVVCDIFKEFCDCAACFVLKRQGACTQCPGL